MIENGTTKRERLAEKVRALESEIADIRREQSRVSPSSDWCKHLAGRRRSVARKLAAAQADLARINDAAKRDAEAAQKAPAKRVLLAEIARLRALLERAGINPDAEREGMG